MSALKGWSVEIGWEAQCDLAAFPWSDQAELGGVLLGYLEGNRVHVRRAVANGFGPDEPQRTRMDIAAGLPHERFAIGPLDVGDCPYDITVCGDVHSHVAASSGASRYLAAASSHDLDCWEKIARRLRQPWLGAVALAREGWAGGFPVSDWEDPELRCWIAQPDGSIEYAQAVTQQDKEFWAIEQTVRQRPKRRTTYGT